jgi:hypothetical protein
MQREIVSIAAHRARGSLPSMRQQFGAMPTLRCSTIRTQTIHGRANVVAPGPAAPSPPRRVDRPSNAERQCADGGKRGAPDPPDGPAPEPGFHFPKGQSIIDN